MKRDELVGGGLKCSFLANVEPDNVVHFIDSQWPMPTVNKNGTKLSGRIDPQGIGSYPYLMPEQPPKRRTTIWFLSSAVQHGQFVWVDCGYCHDRYGRRYYDPGDLMKLFGDVDVNRLSYAMKCERCGRKDNIECDVIVPVAAERERMIVRRLVKIEVRKSPIWRDE